MHRTAAAAIAALSLFSQTAAAGWVSAAADLTAGAASATNITVHAGALGPITISLHAGAGMPAVTRHAFSPTTNTSERSTDLFTASADTYLRLIRPATSDQWPTNGTLRISTNGVSVAAFTNGSTSWTSGLWVSAAVTVSAAATNMADGGWVTIARQDKRSSSYYPGASQILRSAFPGTILPPGSSLTLATNGVTLATFTNGAAAFTEQTDIPSDCAVTVTPDGVTNSAALYLYVQTVASAAVPLNLPCLLRSASPGTILPPGSTITLATNGVTLATLTNGAAAYSQDPPLLLPSSCAVTLTPSGVTNWSSVTLSVQSLLSPSIIAQPGSAVKVSSVRMLGTASVIPDDGTNRVTLALTRYGDASATELATFTNGAAAYTPADALLLLPGDTLTLTTSGVTGAVPFRADTRFQQ